MSVLLAALVACQAWPPAPPPRRPASAAQGDFAGLVDIGGRKLYLECHGTGSPTVVLVAGYPNRADIWSADVLHPGSGRTMVLPGVAAFTHVCAYDRPGTILADSADPGQRSRSDSVPMPRTAKDTVAELHALLRAADVPGPYVLVGHSLGGLIVRLYASTYPDQVAGLVLVDSSHGEQNARFRTLLTPEQFAAVGESTLHPPGLVDYPDLERIDLDASFAQMRQAAAATPLGRLPLVVLSAGRPPDLPPGFPIDAMSRVIRELQADLATMAAKARHVIARESGHYIQLDQPELVIDAVR